MHRRRERLEKRLRELEVLQRGAALAAMSTEGPLLTADDKSHIENFYAANYVIVWHRPVHPRMGKVVWAGEGGVLLTH